jgi:hypothetical protein
MTGQPLTTQGLTITPGNNTYPAYAEVLPNTAFDTHYMSIYCGAVGSAAKLTTLLLKIGIDHSGATTYTDVEILHLFCPCAGLRGQGGIRYNFPLFVPANSAVAASASINNATVGTAEVGVTLWGKPTRPDLVRSGAYVDTFGAVTGTSTGTTITPGTTSESAWVSLASNITRDYWWWQGGCGLSGTVFTNIPYNLDVGVGTSTSVVDTCFEDQSWALYNTSEQACNRLLPDHEYVHYVPGDGALDVFARAQAGATPESTFSAIAYGLGG